MSTKTLLQVVCAAVLLSISAFAVDGVVLINQNTVIAAGGFPYVIAHAGSYKLSGDLTVTSPSIDAIQVSADNVTIDLNGFTISSNSPNGNGSGIIGSSTAAHLVIRNGRVTGFGNGFSIAGRSAVVEEVTSTGNSLGIFIMSGASGTVSNSTANNNGAGIRFDGSGAVINCYFDGNVIGVNIETSPVNVTNNAITHNQIGLSIGFGGYGLNTIMQNSLVDVNAFTSSAVSMGNNACTSGKC